MAHASQDLPDAAIGRAAPDPAPILQLGLGFWASKTLLSAVELGVFTELADEPLDAETLRARLGLHPRGDARLPRRARGARHAAARRARLRRHPRDGAVPGPREPRVHRRDARDGQRPAVRVLGLAHRGAAHGPAAERDQDGRGLLRRPLRRPGAATAVHALHDRPEHRCLACDRRQVPLARARDVRRHRHRRGRAAGDGRPRARAHLGRRLRPASRSARSSRTTSPASGYRTGCASIPATSSPTRCRTPTCSPWATSCTTGTSSGSWRC